MESGTAEASASPIPQDSKNFGLLIWIGTIFLSIIPGVFFYMIKKDDDGFVLAEAKEALNWGITVIMAYMVGGILSITMIGRVLLPMVALGNIIFCVIGANFAAKGKHFRVPIAIRLVK